MSAVAFFIGWLLALAALSGSTLWVAVQSVQTGSLWMYGAFGVLVAVAIAAVTFTVEMIVKR